MNLGESLKIFGQFALTGWTGIFSCVFLFVSALLIYFRFKKAMSERAWISSKENEMAIQLLNKQETADMERQWGSDLEISEGVRKK